MTSLLITKSPTGISCRYSARSQAVTGYGCDRNPAFVSPGPLLSAVSGGIPSKPSSDVLRAQKYGGVGAPTIGQGRVSTGFHNRKSLRAANSNSNRGPSSQAAYATGANLLPAPVATYSTWTVQRGAWS